MLSNRLAVSTWSSSTIRPLTVTTPPPSRDAHAKEVLDAWESRDGGGVVTVNGRMVEELHVETARRLLSIHTAIST